MGRLRKKILFPQQALPFHFPPGTYLKFTSSIKNLISDWSTLLFAVYYHDFIYNARRNDNEEKSAEHAAKVLTDLNYDPELTKKCVSHIMATKSHHLNNDQDTNFLLDADLSILGADWETYKKYFQGVRKEYSIYPDFLYKPGRKKVMEDFLKMDSIFKTAYYFEKLEVQARKNIQQELQLLQ